MGSRSGVPPFISKAGVDQPAGALGVAGANPSIDEHAHGHLAGQQRTQGRHVDGPAGGGAVGGHEAQHLGDGVLAVDLAHDAQRAPAVPVVAAARGRAAQGELQGDALEGERHLRERRGHVPDALVVHAPEEIDVGPGERRDGGVRARAGRAHRLGGRDGGRGTGGADGAGAGADGAGAGGSTAGNGAPGSGDGAGAGAGPAGPPSGEAAGEAGGAGGGVAGAGPPPEHAASEKTRAKEASLRAAVVMGGTLPRPSPPGERKLPPVARVKRPATGAK